MRPECRQPPANPRCTARTARATAPTAAHPNVYADTSPAELGVGPEEQVLINGVEDGIAPPRLAAAYKARMKGARIRDIVLADTGHVELISPGTAAWSRVKEIIDGFVHAR